MRLTLPGNFFSVLVVLTCAVGRIATAWCPKTDRCNSIKFSNIIEALPCMQQHCPGRVTALETVGRKRSNFFNSQTPHKRSDPGEIINYDNSPLKLFSDDDTERLLEDYSIRHILSGLHKRQETFDTVQKDTSNYGSHNVDAVLVALVPVKNIQIPRETRRNPIYTYLQMADMSKFGQATDDEDMDW